MSTLAPEFASESDINAAMAEIPAAASFDMGTETPTGTDDEAPWGRKKDGTPKRKPGRAPGSAGTTGTARRRTTTRAKAGEPDYRPAINGLLQLPAMGLSLVAKATNNDSYAADGAAIILHAPNIAEALNETAKTEPAIAAALDSVLKVGPYGALLAAVTPLVMQIAANHGALPANPQMGILSKQDLNVAMAARAEEMMRG